MYCWNSMPGRLVPVAEFDLTAKIMTVLTEYDDEVAEKIDAAAEECTKGLKKDLRSGSPSDTGAYAKSWTHRTDNEFSKGSKVHTTYNKRHYQLTHLLERPHAGPYGRGSVPGQPHIEPAEKKWNEQFVKLCEEACEG